MAWDHYPMKQETTDILDAITFILTLFFTLELILRLAGYGLIEYFSDNFNIFDFIIVLVSVLDLTISPIPTIYSNEPVEESAGSLAALRAFRLLRYFRFHLILYSNIIILIIPYKSF